MASSWYSCLASNLNFITNSYLRRPQLNAAGFTDLHQVGFELVIPLETVLEDHKPNRLRISDLAQLIQRRLGVLVQVGKHSHITISIQNSLQIQTRNRSIPNVLSQRIPLLEQQLDKQVSRGGVISG